MQVLLVQPAQLKRVVATEMELLRPTRFTKSTGLFLGVVCIAVTAFTVTGCTVDSAKRHYVLAEKLWTDGKYAASVAEFEKVVAKDPHGKLGAQALLRGATTQALFLSQYSEAVRKLRQYVEASPDPSTTWEAQKEIGDLLYSKLEQYDQAVRHYQTLVQLRPDAPEVPEFMYREGRSYFFLNQFDDARKTYEQLIRQYPSSPWSEKGQMEIGQTLLTQGEQSGGRTIAAETYRSAMAAFQSFIQKYPNSTQIPEAQFGVASCLEELDQLDAAYQAYEALRGKYPSKNVIEIKLARIRERKAQRSH
jgi:TolA-binding protein